MSLRAMSRVWDRFPRGGSHMLVALALADWCDDDGRSLYPSIKKVAAKCRLSAVQARRIVHDLIEDGYLEVIGNAAGGAPGCSRQYLFRLDRLTAIADETRTAIASDTPVAGDRPLTQDRDGSHGRSETTLTDESLTIIYPSVTTKSTRTSKSRSKSVNGKTQLPEGFAISEGVRKWAKENGHKNLDAHLEYFIDTIRAKGSRYVDWDAAFKTAVRADWAGLSRRQQGRHGGTEANFAN
ncbi:helix-turn-helix domain-containing protein [Ralstonia sp. CHL-2022]|uniref:helix-turn-helix domain-containing protein n=1 Tax=Ralstonia mojiangensis TaxID=2953895 RepID=UPI0021B28154|nr:helix-turn-helix domain-containing protein [Ralstonia mojiangensis]MCT7295194.1 helix-turn-helix domain-containing protein [Ralstonia mojiangensis]